MAVKDGADSLNTLMVELPSLLRDSINKASKKRIEIDSDDEELVKMTAFKEDEQFGLEDEERSSLDEATQQLSVDPDHGEEADGVEKRQNEAATKKKADKNKCLGAKRTRLAR